MVKQADGVAATDTQCTTSTTFVALPGTAVTFAQNRATDEVISMFQGEWVDGAGVHQLKVDGVAQSGPGRDGSVFAHSGGDDSTHGFNFISDPVAPSRIPRRSSLRG